MRLLTHILTLVLLTTPVMSNAQINFSVNNKPLDQALVELQKESGYSFFYNDELQGLDQTVTLNVQNKDIRQVLDALLEDLGISYEIKDNKQVALFKQQTPQQEAAKIQVKGIVKDENGEPLVGVSVLEAGTTNGCVTDLDGRYSLNVKADGKLTFNYIGYEVVNRNVSGRNVIDVQLRQSAEYLNEVVVTALGIKREKKALSYAVEEVKGDELNVLKSANLASSLAGKVAGVNVSMPSSGVMGSSRVIIRGNGSLNGSNQPLYVVDGVPIDNNNYGQPGMWGGVDEGDGISSINSEDIESMSVLKGGTAAALYGSRAANGAIVINTKQGAKGKVRVEYSLSYTNDTPIFKTDDLQYVWGCGYNGVNTDQMAYGMAYGQVMGMGLKPEEHPEIMNMIIGKAAPALASQMGMLTWGGKMDGSMVTQFDGEKHPYSPNGRDNFKNFYQNAWSLSNNLSISGGSEKIQYRLSVGDKRFHDIMPNSKLSRDNITLGINSKLSEKFSVKSNVMFVYEKAQNRPGLGDLTANANATLYMLPPNVDVRLLEKRVNADGSEFLPTGQTYIQNPYFVAYDMSDIDNKTRLIGSVEAQYNFLPELYLRARFGGDMSERRCRAITPVGTATYPQGMMHNHWVNNGEFNAEAILGYNKNFFDDKFGVNVFAGWNTMGTWWNSIGAEGQNFINPDFTNLGGSGVTSGSESHSESYINSLFGQIELSYDRMLYLNITGRNDWFSALSYPGKKTPNNIFYPSVGLSFILSEAVEMPKWFPYMKFRGSWAQSGGGVGPYNLGLTYGFDQSIGKYPIGSISPTVIPNIDLRPLTSISYEFGFDARFFDNRLGLDMTYYVRNTRDDIVDAGISQASGYEFARINAGQVNNHGVEMLLSATPVRMENFQWDLGFNFAYNHSEVKKITDNIDQFIIETSRTGHDGDNCAPAWIYHQVGQPYGVIKGYKFKRNEDGEILYAHGFPLKEDKVSILGNSVAPYSFGITSNFSFYGFNLSFLIDAKFGAQLFSMTNAHMVSFGRHIDTVQRNYQNEKNETKYGVIGKGVDIETGKANTTPADPMKYYMAYAGITEPFVYDASYVKLRELSFGYTFPKKWLKKAKIESLSIAFIAHNLWNIYDKLPLVDPEAGLNIGNGQGFENYGLPATRSFGFNFNIKF